MENEPLAEYWTLNTGRNLYIILYGLIFYNQ